MNFFQASVINKYLNAQDEKQLKKAYEKFSAYFHNAEIQENIRKAKEEQFQEGFLRELFVNVLGYTLNPQPNYNLTTELKNETGAKKVDGAILIEGKALAVIELKSTKTINLDKVNAQAFNYKNNQSSCVYVITSNFEKLRFFIHNAVEYLEFNLFTLNETDFKLLWFCLNKDSLLAGTAEKAKQESLLADEKVTYQLYKDYSAFKNDLWLNMVKNNPDIDQLLLYRKAQKLLDRLLFIFFSEDSGLLPPNLMSLMERRWKVLEEQDAYKPLYEIFKQFFGYINQGREGKKSGGDIFAYNGGLFLPDEILDSIIIDDEALHSHVMKLTAYNFQSEVDVNILGHIFENSLNDIENIKAQLSGHEVDKNKSRRKKDGVFYTPKYITQYIVDNTVGKICEEKKAELGIDEAEYAKGSKRRRKLTVKKLLEELNAYRDWLLTLTICDPACGSGAFLNQALVFLIKEHAYTDELEAKLFGKGIPFRYVTDKILENNLYGVDINEESVEIAQLSLWLRTAEKGRKLTSLNKNIKCGNSLIDDPKVAGDKAFNWKKEFPDIFSKGGFDIVIGNPPYIFAREKISQEDKNYYSKHYNSADYQINTYLLFIEKTINLIKQKGKYGLIVPNSWLMIYSGKGLRKYILETSTLNKIINLEGYSFDGVNVETIILLAEKEKINNNEFDIYLSQEKAFIFSHLRNQICFFKNKGFEFKVFSDNTSLSLTKKMTENSVSLNALVHIKSGLKAYEKGKGIPIQTSDDIKKRPYDYDFKFDANSYKYLEGKDVGRYFVSWSGLYLKYGECLAAPRTFDLFNGKKIIIREITGKYPKSIIATYNEETYLYNMSNIAIIEKEGKSISLKYILSILNSSLMSYYFMKNTAKSVRKMFPKIILNDLRLFPFKEITKEKQQSFIEKSDKILELNEKLQGKKNKFLNRMHDNFKIKKIGKNLKSFFNYDFKTFVSELKKSKIKLSLIQQDEWEEYFTAYKTEINQLQSEIKTTDKAIDRMVYELYGLTEEEIKIVESA